MAKAGDNGDPVNGPDDPPDPGARVVPGNTTASGMASIERAFLRLTFWQTLLSLAGVFVGAVALYAALNESQAVRQQTAASVWPYLQIMISDNESPSDGHFELQMSNVGVGPARMQSMLLRVDDRAIIGWKFLIDELSEALDEDLSLADYGRSFITNRVIAPGETVSVFQTTHLPLVSALRRGIYSQRATVAYCYCSIFDDCWLQESQSPTTRPVAVDSCPDYGERGFLE